MTRLSFRSAEPDDFAVLTEIWFRAVTATHDFLGPDRIEGYRRRLPVEFLPAVPELEVASIDGEPVGFIGMNDAEIDMLFVAPEHHGEGIGTALIDLVADGRGRLTVDVNEQNPGGVRFYEARGFRETGRSATDPDGNPFPLIHMERAELPG